MKNRVSGIGFRVSGVSDRIAACVLIVVSVLLPLFLTTQCKAIPRFSLLTGTRCSACHFDPQGSGIRTELGWEMMSQTGMLLWGGMDTSGIPATNMLYHGTVVPGGDARFQLVRLSTTGQELLIPM
ncbi:MAG TPA: hypothetical protein VFX22_09795, partial [Candidatus Kapabacteria bacterium]|nr:hypothetical protein [Candidatus Kapabacteria bacterium]